MDKKKEEFIKQLEEYERAVREDVYVDPYKIEDWFEKYSNPEWEEFQELENRFLKIFKEAFGF